MLEKAGLTLIIMLSKTRKNLQLLLPCFVVWLLEAIISWCGGFENLSLLFVPRPKARGMEIKMEKSRISAGIRAYWSF